MRVKHYAILSHFLFWVLDFLRCYQYSDDKPLLEATVWTVFSIIFFYINYSILIPVIFRPDKVSRFFLWGITYLSIFTLGYFGITYVFKIHIIHSTPNFWIWLQNEDHIIRVIGWSSHIIAYYGAVSTMSRLFYDRYCNIQEANNLVEQKTATQINTIRANINTPFFVDVLKDIKTKASKQPDAVADSILHLSSVLRHSLYETSKPTIPASKELETVSHYISLINSKNTNHNISFSHNDSVLDCPPNFIVRCVHYWLEIKNTSINPQISVTSDNKSTTINFPEPLNSKELTNFTNLLNPSSFTFFEISINDRAVTIK